MTSHRVAACGYNSSVTETEAGGYIIRPNVQNKTDNTSHSNKQEGDTARRNLHLVGTVPEVSAEARSAIKIDGYL